MLAQFQVQAPFFRLSVSVTLRVQMTDGAVRDLWRVRLCRPGPNCEHQNCGFAHRLSDLRPPNESERRYDQTWHDGVDRWYRQRMSDEQLRIIKQYYIETPERDKPAWSRALRYCTTGQHDVRERFYPRDYGLSMDLELLCSYRWRGLPFDLTDKLWDKLDERKEELKAGQRTLRLDP